jgi:hypothetical protein
VGPTCRFSLPPPSRAAQGRSGLPPPPPFSIVALSPSLLPRVVAAAIPADSGVGGSDRQWPRAVAVTFSALLASFLQPIPFFLPFSPSCACYAESWVWLAVRSGWESARYLCWLLGSRRIWWSLVWLAWRRHTTIQLCWLASSRWPLSFGYYYSQGRVATHRGLAPSSGGCVYWGQTSASATSSIVARQ